MAHTHRPRWLRCLLGSSESGLTIIELCVAMMVMSVALIGVVGSMGSGLSLVGQGRQRSSATQVAQQAVEHVHDLAYSQVALTTAPTHSNDASNPDYYVNGSNYDSDGPGTQPTEPLYVLSTANGGRVLHTETVSVGPSRFTVYRYVSWVDDPAIASTPCPSGIGTGCDYKRVVVVTVWANAVRAGSVTSVTQSTFITDGKVTLAATAVTPVNPTPGVLDHLAVSGGASSAITGQDVSVTVTAQDVFNNAVTTYRGHVHFSSSDGAATLPADYTFTTPDAGTHSFNVVFHTTGSQTVSATDTTNGVIRATTPAIAISPPPCPGDSIAPTGGSVVVTPAIAGQVGVSIQLTVVDTGYIGGPCAPIKADLSNDGQTWTTMQATLTSGQAASPLSWNVTSTDGLKTVYARFRDGNGNQSITFTGTVILDRTAPLFTLQPRVGACQLSGNSKYVRIDWLASDLNTPVMYQVTKTPPGSTINVSTAASYTDNAPSTNTMYTYSVVATDPAGNHTTSSTLTFTFKNNSGLPC